jgi:hypothetical protein
LGLPGVVRACLSFCDGESNALQTVFSNCKLLLIGNVLQRIEDEDEFEDDLVAASRFAYFCTGSGASKLPFAELELIVLDKCVF